jgi:hypothetical protein
MDEDMSNLKVEFRAQRSLLQALHDTQQEKVHAGVQLIHDKLDRLIDTD